MRAFLSFSAALLCLVAVSSQAGPLLPFAPGRVAEVEGQLLLLPAGWDDWREAELNSALAPGDWLRTGRDASAALELSHSVMARLGPNAELRIERQEGVLVLELIDGSLVVCSGERGEAVSVVTLHGASWLRPDGFYRLNASARRTSVIVHSGLAELERDDRVRSVRPGRLGELASGGAKPSVRSSAGLSWDSFDRDSHEACERVMGLQAELELVGARDLYRHGEWVVIGGEDYWRPHEVGPNWRPYGDGCFRWHPSWGWYFVPRQSWGWVTHHHGWWSWVDGWGWVWLPDNHWQPHRVHFRVVDDNVFWCPRDRGREDHRNRDPEGHRDRGHHDREAIARLPDHAWSRAPILDFGRGPIVRVRPDIGQGQLPRWSIREPGRAPSPAPVEIERPPLPPRAREPQPGVRRPFVARTPRERPPLPSPVTTPTGGLDASPAEPTQPVTLDRPVLPGRVSPPSERRTFPPPRLKPRPWGQADRERLEQPRPEPVPVAPPVARPQREPAPVPRPSRQPAEPVVRQPQRPVVTPTPVIRQPERRPEAPKPVLRQPERRPETPKPERVQERRKDVPKPVVKPPARRSPAPAPVPVPPPKLDEKESADKDDGKRRRR